MVEASPAASVRGERNCNPHISSPQQTDRQNLEAAKATIRIRPHARRSAWERRSPIRFARDAVRRQFSRLQQVCRETGDRAAVDYREGIAVVERQADGRIVLVTVLEKWMSIGNLPVVFDAGPPSGSFRQSPRPTFSLASILSARDRAVLAALRR